MSRYVRLGDLEREDRTWQVWNTNYSCFDGSRIDRYSLPWVAWDSRNGKNYSFATHAEAIGYINWLESL